WARFMPQSGQIPHRADANTIALYTDYESDDQGAYTFFIGVKVRSVADVPDGMVVRQIPPGPYAVFTSEAGPLETVVPAVWQGVWREAGVSRSFRSDFELYDTRAANPAHGIVDLFVGLK
ncbi:MAG: effector binding domain-containing protein, partial [Terriglobia bacterium]